MKNLMISQEGNTFTSALKGMRSNPSLGSSSHKASRSSEFGFFQKSSSSNMHSPRVNITRRKNITLSQLYSEYQRRPEIQYVIRLKNQTSLKAACGAFDHWLSNLQPQRDAHQPVFTQYQQIRCANQQKQPKLREELKRQISENLLKMTAKMQKRQSQATQQSFKVENTIQNRQVKYSFSQYFSQFSQIQHKEHAKPQSITKISIGSDEVTPSAPARNYKECANRDEREALKTYFGKQTLSSHSNKENIKLSSNQMPRKIIGLEFSKNKRFKSTKKKRKACP